MRWPSPNRKAQGQIKDIIEAAYDNGAAAPFAFLPFSIREKGRDEGSAYPAPIPPYEAYLNFINC